MLVCTSINFLVESLYSAKIHTVCIKSFQRNMKAKKFFNFVSYIYIRIIFPRSSFDVCTRNWFGGQLSTYLL